MSDKKKVYVETTVISDATSLPARDIVQASRQLVTKEWLSTADATLNEMWQIKREMSEEFSSWADYVSNLMDYQAAMEQQGVRVVRMPVVRNRVVTAA